MIAAGGASVANVRTGFVESAASRERPCIDGLVEIRTSSPSFAHSMD